MRQRCPVLFEYQVFGSLVTPRQQTYYFPFLIYTKINYRFLISFFFEAESKQYKTNHITSRGVFIELSLSHKRVVFIGRLTI